MATKFHNFDDFWDDKTPNDNELLNELSNKTSNEINRDYLVLAQKIFNENVPEDIVKILVDCHKIGYPDEILNYLVNLNFTSDEFSENHVINLLKTQLLCLKDNLLLININGIIYFRKYEEYSAHIKYMYMPHPDYEHLYINFITWYNVYRFSLSLDEVINKFGCVLDHIKVPFQLVLIRDKKTKKYIRFRKYESVVKNNPEFLIIQHSNYPCLWYIPETINEDVQLNIKALMDKLK